MDSERFLFYEKPSKFLNCKGFLNVQKQLPGSRQLRPATLLNKRLWRRCFPMNFAKFLRTPISIEHLWLYVLVMSRTHFKMNTHSIVT